jgi:hypothetical protein
VGLNKYAIVPLGAADDEKGVAADGGAVLDFEQAKAKALAAMARNGETVPRGKRLLNVCDPHFRMMVQSALETGCRYGELCRLAAMRRPSFRSPTAVFF